MDKIFILHCELTMEQVKLLRDLLYMHEDIVGMRGNPESIELALSLSGAIASGCTLETEHRKDQK